MLRGQMLRGQMSPWQLESVLDVHRNPPLKFHQNRISNSWDIADIELLWWWVGWGLQSNFRVKPNLCWIVVELRLWQFVYQILRLVSQIMVRYSKIIPRYTKSWPDITNSCPYLPSYSQICSRFIQINQSYVHKKGPVWADLSPS